MPTTTQIASYFATLPDPKRTDMKILHDMIMPLGPKGKVQFFDGRNSEGKVVSNPTIGYGSLTKTYADGKTAEQFQVGLSANSTGISVYIMGIEDKTYLINTFGKKLGKASVTGYCIKFKSLKDIDLKVLEAAVKFGFERR